MEAIYGVPMTSRYSGLSLKEGKIVGYTGEKPVSDDDFLLWGSLLAAMILLIGTAVMLMF